MGISPIAIAHSRQEDAKLLGWVTSDNTCGGYFFETPMPTTKNSMMSLRTQPVTITANAGQLKYSGTSTLSGPVLVNQPGRLIKANQVSLVTENGDYKTAQLKGNVVLREKGKIAIGQEADLDLQNDRYSLLDIIYRVLIGHSLSGWGKAGEATQPPDGITVLKNVTYSTCPPQSRAWEMSANKITLDQSAGRGFSICLMLVSRLMMKEKRVFYILYLVLVEAQVLEWACLFIGIWHPIMMMYLHQVITRNVGF
jgi:LPS-assembly protein